jgi:acetyltransferase-like isoleucine patch superfamily enzyme
VATRPLWSCRKLLADLTGKPVDDSVAVFPPFYSEFGKNLTLGQDVFINSGCRSFQDTGGSLSGTARSSATAAP